jgi:Ca-activated chloride channel family protein
VIGAALSGSAAPALAQAPLPDKDRTAISVRARKPVPGRDSILRVDTNLVLVPVTVTDPSGVPVTGLQRQTFRLLEDKVEQKITYFSTQDAPVSGAIIFDASGSMANKLVEARQAIADFLKTSMPGDEFSLIRFSDNPTLVQGLTSKTEDIESQLPYIQAKGWTALFDSIYLGVQNVRRGKNSRKIIFLLSDGGDNNSRYTESEMRNLVMESDVCIYSIGLLGTGLSKRNVRLLSRLSDATGGRFFPVEKLSELRDAVERISAQIRNQYLLGYTPALFLRDGKYRHVEVTLAQPSSGPPLRASWRTGYYSPVP